MNEDPAQSLRLVDVAPELTGEPAVRSKIDPSNRFSCIRSTFHAPSTDHHVLARRTDRRPVMQIGNLRALMRTAVLLVALATACAVAHAKDKWFQLDGNDLFGDWRTQMQELVDQDANTGPTRICVVGVTDGDLSSLEAFVIWPSHRRLITWIPSKNDSHSLLHQTRVLNLDTDVVSSERQVAGSTYLVTRAWLRNIEQRCKAQGTTLTLTSRRER